MVVTFSATVNKWAAPVAFPVCHEVECHNVATRKKYNNGLIDI